MMTLTRCCQLLLSTAVEPSGRAAAQPFDLRFREVARGGVEPPTFRFSVGRSYQLSYLAGSTRTRSGQTSAGSLRRAQLYRRAHRSPNHDHPSASRAGKPPVATGGFPRAWRTADRIRASGGLLGIVTPAGAIRHSSVRGLATSDRPGQVAQLVRASD